VPTFRVEKSIEPMETAPQPMGVECRSALVGRVRSTRRGAAISAPAIRGRGRARTMWSGPCGIAIRLNRIAQPICSADRGVGKTTMARIFGPSA